MKEFIMMYIDIVQNNHDLVGQVSFRAEKPFMNLNVFRQQVHTDFKRQFLDLTVDKLLEQFVLNKYTGLEKPGECTCCNNDSFA
jgi:F-BAR domain only protein